jgi:hypothetical protein
VDFWKKSVFAADLPLFGVKLSMIRFGMFPLKQQFYHEKGGLGAV